MTQGAQSVSGILMAGIACWVCGVSSGYFALISYATTSGAAGPAPHTNPQLRETTSDDRCRLLMFIHPQCSCSRASLRELNRLMSEYSDRIRATVYVYAPKQQTDSWHRTGLFSSAAQIPGTEAVADTDGHVARRYFAATSGHTVLYDSTGQLMFQGGVTVARAHEGDSPGSASLRRIADGEQPEQTSAPVFGCPLFSDSAEETCGGASCLP